jgi:hypothetical protein
MVGFRFSVDKNILRFKSSQLVPKLYLGTEMVAKLSLADKGAFPSSAWERAEIIGDV